MGTDLAGRGRAAPEIGAEKARRRKRSPACPGGIEWTRDGRAPLPAIGAAASAAALRNAKCEAVLELFAWSTT
jgi:hypothetical protein